MNVEVLDKGKLTLNVRMTRFLLPTVRIAMEMEKCALIATRQKLSAAVMIKTWNKGKNQ